MPPGPSRAADFFDIESLGLGLSQASRKSAEYLSRNASSSGNTQDGTPTSAAEISASLLETYRTILAEVDSYVSLYEGRLKLEEDYLRNFKQLVDKQRELDAKVNAKMASVTGLLPDTIQYPGLRNSWRELRENDLRELDARAHTIETIRQAVLTPLLAFRDSQERIRKRVKEDLRTSLSHYDDMRNVTLPRIRKAYERKAEEVEQLQLQQRAVEEQRALLASRTTEREGSTGSSGARMSSPEPDVDGGASAPAIRVAPRRSRSIKRHSRGTSSSSSHAVASAAQRDALSADERSPASSPKGTPAQLSTSVPTEAGASLPSPNSERSRPNFFEAFKSREGWEAARKEAPKKIGALISRMREGREAGPVAGGAGGQGSSYPEGSGNNTIVGLGATVGDTLRNGLGGGPGSMRANQSIALKHFKAKREAEELDKSYRKAVFDLETSRLRRAKTIKAAATSVIECRNELAHTAQAVWMQSERSLIVLNSQSLSLHEHGVKLVQQALVDLDRELAELEQNLPNTKDLNEQRLNYVNYWHGELKNLIFGTPLTDYPLTVPYRLSDTVAPPLIVTKCIAFIETYALDQEGIYRTSAKQSSVKALALAIEKDELGFQFDPEKDEASAVAGVFKDYLRQLPEPVLNIPWAERIKYTHEREEHIRTGFAKLKGRLRRLPPIHQVTLKVIVQHLARVAEHSDRNKMTASNLSVVFSPCLLSEADHETTSVAAAMEEDKTMEDLILYCKEVFDLSTAGAPILPPIAHVPSDELSRAGRGAAEAVFANSSAATPAAEPSQETVIDAPAEPASAPSERIDPMRSDFVVLPVARSSAGDTVDTLLLPQPSKEAGSLPPDQQSRPSTAVSSVRLRSPQTPERPSSSSSVKSISPRQNSVAASIRAFESRTPPPSLPRISTAALRKASASKIDRVLEPTQQQSEASADARPATDGSSAATSKTSLVSAPILVVEQEGAYAESPIALSAETGQTYLAASMAMSTSKSTSPASATPGHHAGGGAVGFTASGPLAPGRLMPSSLRSPLESVIDSANASHGHRSPAAEAGSSGDASEAVAEAATATAQPPS
ncbi:hypothetical protein ACQY0O_004216 [Thecaphora frezii]